MGHDVDRLVVTIFIYLFVVIIFLYDYIRVPTTGFSSSVGVRIYLDVIFNMYYRMYVDLGRGGGRSLEVLAPGQTNLIMAKQLLATVALGLAATASANDPAGSWLSYAAYTDPGHGIITALNTTWKVPSNPASNWGSNAPG